MSDKKSNTQTAKPVLECKFAVGKCPFGKACRYQHKPSHSVDSNKVKAAVKEHVQSVMSKNAKRRPSDVGGNKKGTVKDAINRSIGRVKSLMDAKKALEAEKKGFDSKYVSVDSKGKKDSPFDDKLSLNALQLKEERGLIRSLVGTSVTMMEFNSIIDNAFSLTGASIDLFPVDPTRDPRFQFAALIFDEYRVLEFECKIYSTSFAGVPAAGAVNQNGYGVVVYDPADPTPLASRVEAAGNDYKVLMPIALTVLGTNSCIRVIDAPVTLAHKVPKGTLLSAGVAPTNATGSTWQSTQGVGGNFLPYGFIKWWVQGVANSDNTTVFDAVIMHKVEFRIANGEQ